MVTPTDGVTEGDERRPTKIYGRQRLGKAAEGAAHQD